jgi:hypothetical protein
MAPAANPAAAGKIPWATADETVPEYRLDHLWDGTRARRVQEDLRYRDTRLATPYGERESVRDSLETDDDRQDERDFLQT